MSKIDVGGGTTLEAGLGCGINLFNNFAKKNKESTDKIQREKRIIMVTDMEDMGAGL